MKIKWGLKSALVSLYGSQVIASRELEIRESKLSYIVRGHAEPSDRERKALEDALGKKVMRKLLRDESQPGAR